MKPGRILSLLTGVAFSAALLNAGSLGFTCDSTIGTLEGSGVCAYLNSDVAGIYDSVFTNANASIYITTSSSGLGGNSTFTQYVTYSEYYSALSAESTDATALASLPATEPGIFSSSSQYVGVTSALTDALGIPAADTGYGTIYGVSPGSGGTDPSLSVCVLGSADCYDGVIEIVTPAGLSSETGGSQGLWYRDVAGTASGPQPSNDYDFFSVVEHETDEVLGTSSCSSIDAGPTVENDCTAGGQIGPSPSAVDLFRYSAPGTRVFNSLTPAYFSFNGGVTDYDGNTYNTTKANEDYADFHQGCVFIQDAEGCPGQSIDITNDYLGGVGPEVSILNAVGYDLQTPEPGTMFLFGAALGVLGLCQRRRRRL